MGPIETGSKIAGLLGREAAGIEPAPGQSQEPAQELDWAGLLRRSFALDVFACGRCGGRCQVLAYLTAPGGVRAILEHLGLSDPFSELLRFSRSYFPRYEGGHELQPHLRPLADSKRLPSHAHESSPGRQRLLPQPLFGTRHVRKDMCRID